ncbi:uncharacterized protein K452DRAFT_312214 [Aplosporella prunicola CBS 121167]|uniref:Uncharacterized protein n=1 Tax=Aplosporella prunicola CBS 121167 TaxID=1176127 RepID=A0A6A6B302_9PEZI|nr:uncharacterized protein K452DRAFT_312214 [Aplosporella prunicola CBS 121167]KAF2137604.1 hypothetical protein K452DRAFT_312214 [Aplosporella prunicola CBS 121167]
MYIRSWAGWRAVLSKRTGDTREVLATTVLYVVPCPSHPSPIAADHGGEDGEERLPNREGGPGMQVQVRRSAGAAKAARASNAQKVVSGQAAAACNDALALRSENSRAASHVTPPCLAFSDWPFRYWTGWLSDVYKYLAGSFAYPILPRLQTFANALLSPPAGLMSIGSDAAVSSVASLPRVLSFSILFDIDILLPKRRQALNSMFTDHWKHTPDVWLWLSTATFGSHAMNDGIMRLPRLQPWPDTDYSVYNSRSSHVLFTRRPTSQRSAAQPGSRGACRR